MTSCSNDQILNLKSPFTELFDALKNLKKKDWENEFTLELITSDKLLVLSDSCIVSILHGLQGIGSIMALSNLSNQEDTMQLGYFISLMANLVEALHLLRLDIENRFMGNKTAVNCD